jgi:hypothetical protein
VGAVPQPQGGKQKAPPGRAALLELLQIGFGNPA